MVQQLVLFHGLANEDPNNHIGAFLEVYTILKVNAVSKVARLLAKLLQKDMASNLDAKCMTAFTTLREKLV